MGSSNTGSSAGGGGGGTSETAGSFRQIENELNEQKVTHVSERCLHALEEATNSPCSMHLENI